MTVGKLVEARGITEVLHFTTNTGLLGILASRGIMSRARLPKAKYLEHVYRPNAMFRRDPDWVDYVNLSITRINAEFFGHSSRWHKERDVWWCVVSISPVVLTHAGVVFATTNNMYSGARHASGPEGMEALFAPRILRYERSQVERSQGCAENLTTCPQAEALYPRFVPTEHFRGIYVATGEHADIVGSQSEVLLPPDAETPESSELPIYVRPDVFEP